MLQTIHDIPLQASTALADAALEAPAQARPVDWVGMRGIAMPVQTLVKREDEQAFARLNAAHLMFCEDAARRIAAALQDRTEIDGYDVRVAHFESLHAHDAVAQVSGGKRDGFAPRKDAPRGCGTFC